MSLNVFFKRLLGVFSKSPACTGIGRGASYRARFEAWNKSTQSQILVGAFNKAYHYQKAGLRHAYRVQLLHENHRNGAVLFYDPSLKADEFSFLFDYLKDQALALGYKLKSAHKRKLSYDKDIQATETYLLTPLPHDVPGTQLCDQRFGHILIDHTKINGRPGYIRIITEEIPDQHFSQPKPFRELLDKLLPSTQND